MHVSCWDTQGKQCYSEVQISVTSESVSLIMDVGLNVLKYPQLGQSAELLVLSLTGLRNTGVIIPSHQLATRLPRVLIVTHAMSGGEETSHTHTHSLTHTHPYTYISGNQENVYMPTHRPSVKRSMSSSPLKWCSDRYSPSLCRFIYYFYLFLIFCLRHFWSTVWEVTSHVGGWMRNALITMAMQRWNHNTNYSWESCN